ncbi:MAG TPA: hypothetical protein EYP24_02510 [bacterium (Candidatus Stahlbacteria)]|nr:hypothetical protein [Candidatus Stahlbacteria bacterium]
MSFLEPRVRLILCLILILGIFGIDETIDITIYTTIILFILFYSMRPLPVIIPIPAFVAIIGMNYLFVKALALNRGLKFYFATVISIQYASLSSAIEITAALGWLLRFFHIRKEEELYTIIATAKTIQLKGLSLRNLPQWIVSLLNMDIEMKDPESSVLRRIVLKDLFALILAILISSYTILS